MNPIEFGQLDNKTIHTSYNTWLNPMSPIVGIDSIYWYSNDANSNLRILMMPSKEFSNSVINYYNSKHR